MKKSVWKLIALLLAAMMAVALVGCDIAGTSDQTTEGTEQGSDSDKEEPLPEEIVSDVVTEAEWTAAFAAENFENVKIEGINTCSGTSDGPFTITEMPTMVRSENFVHLTDSFQTTGTGEMVDSYKDRFTRSYGCFLNSKDKLAFDVYYDFETEMIYQTNDEGIWKKTTANSAQKGVIDNSTSVSSAEYSEWHYDEAQKGYRHDYPGLEYYYVYKFKDGKLVEMIMHHEMELYGKKMTEDIKITFTYGGQSVTLPEVK